ncbi:MAG: trigger factor [Isosphaeraceae bacterium]
MSTDELESESGGTVTVEVLSDPQEPGTSELKPDLDMAVEISDVGPCKKHIKVTIPQAEIKKEYAESLETLRKEAVVPGFRPGKAPRQLIVKRFRKEVSDQVKSKLLMSSLEQIDKNYKLDPITQPKLDVAAIELPEEGPMQFEMDVEVRPQFDVPDYKGLSLKRPVKSITDREIDTELNYYLERYGQIVPKLEGAAELGDYVTADLAFIRPDGVALNEVKEIQFRLQPELRYQDGSIPNLGAALVGAKPGETRKAEAKMGTAARDPRLRGASLGVQIRVHDLKQVRLPEINQAFLDSIEFDSLGELREAVHEALKRRAASQQRMALRQQILGQLLGQTPFALPSDLVTREEANTIRRLVRELRQQGMSDEDIRAREAEIRANAHESTLQSLKEFLLLAKIAEAEGITVDDSDVGVELEATAERTGESVRRIRARLDKEGMTEDLTTQILERKVLDRILEFSTIVDDVVTSVEPESRVETLDHTAEAATDEPTSPEETVDAAGTETPAES